MTISSVVKAIVRGVLENAGLNLIVSFAPFAPVWVISSRKLPAPLSLVFVTGKVAALTVIIAITVNKTNKSALIFRSSAFERKINNLRAFLITANRNKSFISKKLCLTLFQLRSF